MSKVLLSWVPPRKDATNSKWRDLREYWFVAACLIVLVLMPLAYLVEKRFDGDILWRWPAMLLIIRSHILMMRPIAYQLTEDGIRIRRLWLSEFYGWNEIDYYRFQLRSNHNERPQFYFKARHGRRRRISWETLDFDPGQVDESTLRGILTEKLAGKNFDKTKREEIHHAIAA